MCELRRGFLRQTRKHGQELVSGSRHCPSLAASWLQSSCHIPQTCLRPTYRKDKDANVPIPFHQENASSTLPAVLGPWPP